MAANLLYGKYPNTKFSVYDYKYYSYNFSMGLSLILDFDKKIDSNGMRIGINCVGSKCAQNLPVILNEPFTINDLSGNVKFGRESWTNVNRVSVYDDLIGWLNKNQLKSTFDLRKYIMER